jgi:hypothetical protein
MNKKVLIFSILGLIFVALAIIIDWLFLIGAVVCMLLNQRALFGAKPGLKKDKSSKDI